MRKSDLQACATSVLLMEALLLWVCSLGTNVQAANPASAFEPAHADAAQGTQQNTSPEKAPAKKQGHVRIATLGPRPLSVDAKAGPQKIVGQVIAHWQREFSQVLPDQPDLNFDELRLKYVKAKPDLIVFSSMYHGGFMQAYWAYSCRAHFVGAVAGLPCEIRNPLGEIVASNTNYFDYAVADVNLDCRLAHLDYNWSRLRALKSKYGPKVRITDPGFLGCVLVSSEDEKTPIDEMIREFQIELLDGYMARALTHRHKTGNME